VKPHLTQPLALQDNPFVSPARKQLSLQGGAVLDAVLEVCGATYQLLSNENLLIDIQPRRAERGTAECVSSQEEEYPGSDTGYTTEYAWRRRPDVSVPHALLALLSEAPKYGLRLQNEFESRTGEVWPLNVGQVYTTLQRLERGGLVETDDEKGERSQKRFRLTSAGARELADWLSTPPELVPPPRSELVIKVLIAARLPGVDVQEIVQSHRRQVVEVMQRYTHLKAEAPGDDVGLAIVVDAELFRLEAIVRWLDAADVRLKQLPQAAPVAAPAVALEPTRTMEVSQ
jgi:DNA-binding PadR family transcriptional regulator